MTYVRQVSRNAGHVFTLDKMQELIMGEVKWGDNPDLKKTLADQRAFFRSGKTLDTAFRKEQLEKLYQAVIAGEEEIACAMYSDFRKPPHEVYMTETGPLLHEIRNTIKNLDKWTAPKRIRTPLMLQPGSSVIYREPYGVSLIIAPWNYPLNLMLIPLVGAMAAGNTSILKTSPASAAVSSLISRMMSGTFSEDYIAVFQGGRDVNKELFSEKYDYIFFTGSPALGKEVYRAAAENLTPVTLELGGKSPCIVADDADISLSARRIVWGKFINAGQTCIAPDYILVSAQKKKELLEALSGEMKKFYGNNVKNSSDYARIISDDHFDRLEKFLRNGKIAAGGIADKSDRYISPTVIDEIGPDDPVMQEEIFGPILPVITVGSLDEAVKFINDRPKPLALYLFTESRKISEDVITKTSAGGSCINDTLTHFANSSLPFGGVGMSGIGSYHGENSIRTFSHERSVLKKSKYFDFSFRYAPYSGMKLKIIKFFLK